MFLERLNESIDDGGVGETAISFEEISEGESNAARVR
jgi:hypothetical protein